MRGAICYRGNRPGHISWECQQNFSEHWKHSATPHVPRERPPEMEMVEVMDCSFGCGDEVPVWDWPVVKAWTSGKSIQVILDTGCSQTLIRADLVPRESIQWSKPICMRCIRGGSNQYEWVFLQMKVANHQGCIWVGLAPDLNCAMIIGWDWPPVYEGLDQVKRSEEEQKGWPIREGWIGKEDIAPPTDKEWLLDLEGIASSLQFKMAHDEEEEFIRIWEQEVSWIEGMPWVECKWPSFWNKEGIAV